MNCNDVKAGAKVTVVRLDETTGMLIHAKHLDCRRLGATGTITGPVAGHGGDVWWVRHDDSIAAIRVAEGFCEVAAYTFEEIEACVAVA